MIVVATLPLFAVLPVKSKVEAAFTNVIFVSVALIATGFLLFFFRFGSHRAERQPELRL